MKKIPLPGQPVRGSRSGAPIMALFDLLGRRWAMGVLWVLCEAGGASFSALQARCGTISPSVLNRRLQELQLAGLVRKSEQGYEATPLGRKIHGQLVPLGAIAKTWAARIDGQRSGDH